MLPSYYTCPRCKCHALCRLRRKTIDAVFSLFGLSPVRCLTCGRKSYQRIAKKDRTSSSSRRTVAPARITPVHSQHGPRRVA